MRLVYNDPIEVKRKFVNSVRYFQEGGTNPGMGMEQEMPMEEMAQPAGPDVQGMMAEFAQSQSPDAAVQILQTLASDPALAVNVVNMLVQQMQASQPQKAMTEEVPTAKKGMKLDAMTMDEAFSKRGNSKTPKLSKKQQEELNKKRAEQEKKTKMHKARAQPLKIKR